MTPIVSESRRRVFTKIQKLHTYDALGRSIQKQVIDYRAENDPPRCLAVTGNWSSWGSNFWGAFHTNFRIGAAFLAGGVIAADVFGGGVAAAGGNGLNGWVASNNAFGVPGGGGLAIGSATTFAGADSIGAIRSHEFGHTLQFFGLSALSGAAGTGSAGVWGAYGGLGVWGAVVPTGSGAWWEGMAWGLGGI